jgi:hypothetical protein
MLSIVATFCRRSKVSGAKFPNAHQAPLNSSISTMRLRISGVQAAVLKGDGREGVI